MAATSPPPTPPGILDTFDVFKNIRSLGAPPSSFASRLFKKNLVNNFQAGIQNCSLESLQV